MFDPAQEARREDGLFVECPQAACAAPLHWPPMSIHEFRPPFVPLGDRDRVLARQGYALLDASQVTTWLGLDGPAQASLQPFSGMLGRHAQASDLRRDGARVRLHLAVVIQLSG